MLADAEVVKVLNDVLEALDIGAFEIKLNHRNGMLAICGVSEDKFQSIYSAIDKLGKAPWQDVRAEMVNRKGLAAVVADRIGEHVLRRGRAMDVLNELKQQQEYLDHPGSAEALEELAMLLKLLARGKNCVDRLVLDLSLARGLDYYTGVIFEAVTATSVEIGSVAAGCRYDNLVQSMFGAQQVPVVGLSLGVERLLVIIEEAARIEAKNKNKDLPTKETEVLVLYVAKDEGELEEKRADACFGALVCLPKCRV